MKTLVVCVSVSVCGRAGKLGRLRVHGLADGGRSGPPRPTQTRVSACVLVTVSCEFYPSRSNVAQRRGSPPDDSDSGPGCRLCTGLIDGSVNSNVINISELSSVRMPL